MLDIALIPKSSGSNGFGRFYPHQGYLGLSPVTVSGVIVSRLPPLCPTLPIRQVTLAIRCIETRTIGTEVEAVLWERAKRLWEADDEYEELGDWSAPFSMGIPVDAAREAVSAQWTRDTKVVWQLQVAFEHKPIQYVGTRIVKTYLLDLHSYINHPILPPSPPSAINLPGAQVFINAPHGTYGPGETFTLSLHVKPDDPVASIRKTTLVFERYTQLLSVEKTKRRSYSPGYTKLEEPSTHTSKISETYTKEAIPGSGGTFWITITGTVPKRGGRWEAGESGITKLSSTTFGCRLKIGLKVKNRTKEIISPSIPITLVGASTEERSLAYAELDLKPQRKHRSSRRGLYMQEGTTDIDDPIHRRSVSPNTYASPPEVKPILITNPPPQPNSISFAFPAPALPITTLIHPPSPVYEDISILRQYQSTGRRISATTSEEEEIQPSRSRIRLDKPTRDRPSLPSLDVLGVGLPLVPDRGPQRPRTAPAHSAFPSYTGRPGSAGAPPPLSGLPFLSPDRSRPTTMSFGGSKREAEEDAFAFR